jgi:toxin YoeB
MKLKSQTEAREDYLYWQQTNKKVLRRLNDLIKECLRTPFTGIGKPEPLRGNFAGYWSRRITDEHRLVYLVHDKGIYIVQCRYHYN